MLKPCPDAVDWYTTPVPPPRLSLMIVRGFVSDTPGTLFKVNTLPTSKFPLIAVSLYNVILIVVDNLMYERPLTFR